MKDLGMLIDGEFQAPRPGQHSIEVWNPATGELVGRVPAATADDVDAACQSAQKAFHSWRGLPAVQRARAMKAAASAIRERADTLAALLTAEQGKPLPQARGEILNFSDLIDFYAEEARRINGMVVPSDDTDRSVFVLREPVGVVAAIPPWNDPLALLGRMVGPAWAAGCTVVAKPSSETPFATLEVARIALEAGLPSGVFNVITGRGSDAGELLVKHPLVAKVAFTGSLEGGRRVMELAALGVKRVTLELGGQSPAIVWEDADLERAADAIVFQAYRSAGQVCNRVNRVYVHERVASELIERLTALVRRIRVGPGTEPGVDIGPLVNRRQLEWVQGHVTDAVEHGATVAAGGKRLTGGLYDRGFFFEPTLLTECRSDMRVMREETFGPVLGVQEVGQLEEAFRLANDTPYGLSAYFFSKDMRRCFQAMQHMQAGSLWINDIHRSYLQAPYGGMKQSGIGREQGTVAVNEYLEYKTVYLDLSEAARGPYLCVHKEPS